MKRILVLLAFVTMLTGCVTSPAYAAVPSVTYVWTAPTTGTDVVNYVVELSTAGGPWTFVADAPDTTYEFVDIFEYGISYQVRIAGVDDQSRQGPFSLPSDPYVPDAGAPGIPGKPIIIQF